MDSIYNHTLQDLTNSLVLNNFKAFNAKQIWSWLYRKNISSFSEMSNISYKLKDYLQQNYKFSVLKVKLINVSNDETRKYIFKLEDDNLVESVLIPEKERLTLCISSQIGCKLNCSFCATAKIGFKRNLTTSEIVGQLLEVQNDIGKRITNVVFMGMGEPFDNYTNTIKAAQIFSEDLGLAIGTRKITISTSGIIKNIKKFTLEDRRFRLAVSLHSPFDLERSKIMPVNKTNHLTELIQSLKEYTLKSKRKVVFEYILLKDVNDTIQHAKKLKEILCQFPSKLNLIKFHENPFSNFKCSTEQQINLFYKSFKGSNFPVVIRGSRGEDISAACGQLHLQQNKHKGSNE